MKKDLDKDDFKYMVDDRLNLSMYTKPTIEVRVKSEQDEEEFLNIARRYKDHGFLFLAPTSKQIPSEIACSVDYTTFHDDSMYRDPFFNRHYNCIIINDLNGMTNPTELLLKCVQHCKSIHITVRYEADLDMIEGFFAPQLINPDSFL